MTQDKKTFDLTIVWRYRRFIYRNIIDLFEAMIPHTSDVQSKHVGKRILIFNWRDSKHAFAGGAEVYIHELAKRWVKKGYGVTLFCGNDGNDPRYEVIDGVEIIRRGGFYFVYLWAFLYYLLKLRKHVDIIIDTQNGIPFFTPLYANKTIYCLMFHVHQEVFQKSLIKPLAIIASRLEKNAMPLVYKRIKFITISQSTKNDMEKIGLGKAGIEIIFPGVDIQHLKPGKKTQAPMVLYLGRLKYYKSVHILIKAAVKILKRLPNVEFIIAGEGEEKSRLEKLAQKLHVERQVKFYGKVSEQEKIDLYKKAWIFVNPSMMEGWGLTVIEANACGTPVIASNVPGLRDSISNPHTGYLVEYGNVDLFANKVIELIQNKKTLQSMSSEARNWAQKFDWEKSADKFLLLLRITRQKKTVVYEK